MIIQVMCVMLPNKDTFKDHIKWLDKWSFHSCVDKFLTETNLGV